MSFKALCRWNRGVCYACYTRIRLRNGDYREFPEIAPGEMRPEAGTHMGVPGSAGLGGTQYCREAQKGKRRRRRGEGEQEKFKYRRRSRWNFGCPKREVEEQVGKLEGKAIGDIWSLGRRSRSCDGDWIRRIADSRRFRLRGGHFVGDRSRSPIREENYRTG